MKAASLIAATLLVCDAATAPAQEGRQSLLALTSASVADMAIDSRFGYPAVSTEDLARIGFTDVQARAGVLSAMLNGARIQLYAGSPFFRYGKAVYQLPNAPYDAGGAYWVPVSLLTGWTDRSPRPRSADVVRPAGDLAAGGAEPGGPEAVPGRPIRPLRVVIDPGHGGRDPGTIGRLGTREKDVVLAIARRVHAKLSSTPGVQPILTRDRDVLIPLRKRSQLAVAQEANLFVSIHANASKDRRAQGFETYFLGEARTELSREVAMRENSAVQYEEEGGAPRPDEIQFILSGLSLASYQRESGRLGGYVQNSLRGSMRTPDRGVKQNVFWVLVGATGSMPSILVEVGFLSNAEEENLLRSAAGQQRVADAIVSAIVAYRDDYTPRLQAAGAR